MHHTAGRGAPLPETRMSTRLRSVWMSLALILGALVVTAATGCKKQCSPTEGCYEVPQ